MRAFSAGKKTTNGTLATLHDHLTSLLRLDWVMGWMLTTESRTCSRRDKQPFHVVRQFRQFVPEEYRGDGKTDASS